MTMEKMLTSSSSTNSYASQYLQPDYFRPLTPTTDSKLSPLTLLAQTCNSIGKDSNSSSKSTSTAAVNGDRKPPHSGSSGSSSSRHNSANESPNTSAAQNGDVEGRSHSRSSSHKSRAAAAIRSSPSPRQPGSHIVPSDPKPSSLSAGGHHPADRARSSSPPRRSSAGVAGCSSSTKPSSSAPFSLPFSNVDQLSSSLQDPLGLSLFSQLYGAALKAAELDGLQAVQKYAAAMSAAVGGNGLSAPGSLYPFLPPQSMQPQHPVSASLNPLAIAAAYSANLQAAAAAAAKYGRMSPHAGVLPSQQMSPLSAAAAASSYARLKAAAAAAAAGSNCSDPCCLQCVTTHLSTGGGSCAGCMRCGGTNGNFVHSSDASKFHNRHQSQQQGAFGCGGGAFAAALSALCRPPGPVQPSADSAATHTCNWLDPSGTYCGRHFANVDELMIHLQSHCGQAAAAATAVDLAALYPSMAPFPSVAFPPGFDYPSSLIGRHQQQPSSKNRSSPSASALSLGSNSSSMSRYHPYRVPALLPASTTTATSVSAGSGSSLPMSGLPPSLAAYYSALYAGKAGMTSPGCVEPPIPLVRLQ